MLVPNLKGPAAEQQYKNLSYFDKGGMGQVYKAFDDINKLDVAIKLIPIANKDEEELLAREVKVSQEIVSENLVETYYCDQIELTGTEYFYIVQRFYPKGSLRRSVQKDIPFEICLSMFLDLLNGLKALHTKIVHRDLKPENILIDDNDHLVITDFGLAKFIGEKTKTRSFKGAGTIPYMSPECWLNEENTIQMDIYSLGIIFYELLTGEFPFSGRSEQEWRDSHLYDSLPNIDEKRERIPTKIKQVISKMTNKRAKDRYSSVEEIITAIHESIAQTKESDKEIERLASISHKKTEEIRAEQLKLKQEQEEKMQLSKFIYYHIDELKDRVKSILDAFNSRIEEKKLTFSDDSRTYGMQNIKFSISLKNVYTTFEFFDIEAVKEYEERREAIFKQNQIERHGGMISSLGDSAIRRNSIIYVGRVRTNYHNAKLGGSFGLNLLLVKKEKDIYGEWYVASFSDSGFTKTNRRDFGLDLQEFFREFEKCVAMHVLTVDYQKLQDKHIYRVIEETISH